jgi:23S rRNA (guanosine2251-2'-O)-methyltransferase
MEVLYGFNAVGEAIKAGRRRFDHVLIARERHDERLERLAALCREAGVRIRQESREQLTQLAQTPAHQGVVALVRPQEFLALEDLFEPSDPGVPSDRSSSLGWEPGVPSDRSSSLGWEPGVPSDRSSSLGWEPGVPSDRSSSLGWEPGAARLLLALDGVEDPQNLGALLRVADGAGVDGVLLTERRSAPLSPAAVKASAGAAEHLRIARVVNLVRALEELKRRNLWIIGLDERGTSDYDQFDFTGDCVLVLGREGAGLHELVRRTCDHLLRIPMAGGVSSLNVSASGAVVLYEAFRQRRLAASRADGARPAAEAASKPKKQKGLGS